MMSRLPLLGFFLLALSAVTTVDAASKPATAFVVSSPLSSSRRPSRPSTLLQKINGHASSIHPSLAPPGSQAVPTMIGKRQNSVLNPRPRHPSSSSSSSSSSALFYTVSPEPIHAAFSVATFGPQFFWLLMIVLPKSDITKKVMGGFEIVLLFCLVHFFIVSGSIATGGSEATAPLAEFNEVFNPAGDPQNAFIGMVTNYPNFVAEEWSHVLTWDLFVGRYIWLDGLRRGIFTSHSVLLSNLIGPPGLLLHWITCLVVGKEPWEKETLLSDSSTAES